LLVKGIERLAHKLTLVNTELHILQAANEALSKRRRAKKNCICQEGVLTVEEAHNIIAQNEVDKQIQRDKRSREVNCKERNSRARHCSAYRKTSYYASTCQEVVDILSLLEFKE
jgi:hypothetical protein